jgi:SAM-dependent methyltransferase
MPETTAIPDLTPASSLPADDALFRLGAWLHRSGYRFVTVTPATHARVNVRTGTDDAKSLQDVFGWSRPFRRSLLPRQVLGWLEQGDGLEYEGGLLRSKFRFSTLGDSVYMHSAYPTADPDAVFFGPDTYRFAALIQRTLATPGGARVDRVVDVGCGAGAGGIVAVKALKEPVSHLILADINPAALRHARINAALAGMQEANFRQGDLFHVIDQPIDLIVANPPYMLDPAARLYRHGGGEFGSGLSTRIVVEGLPRLAAGGILILYTGAPIVDGRDTFWDSVAPVVHAANVGYDYVELDPDVFGEELECPAYSKVERIAAVALVIRASRSAAEIRGAGSARSAARA